MSTDNQPVPGFLAHRESDSVAVAVTDLAAGQAHGGYLHSGEDLDVELREAVPLGHKFALRDIEEGADVIEYGVRVAVASTAIRKGEHVHVHNVRSARWQHSVAS
jgi:(2R)-sulfolactate sulfo-lyase subunit alpha